MLEYKVVELSVVTDDSMEETINKWIRQDWQFEGVSFVVREASRRPSMAFVYFVRDSGEEVEPESEQDLPTNGANS